MKKLVLSAFFFSAIAWLWIGNMIAADGNLANQNGTTVAGAANMTNSVLFTTAITNSGNIQSATLNTTGTIGSGGRYTGTDAILASSTLYWGAGGNRGRINVPSSGVVTFLDATDVDFSRIQLGGTTAAFPSLKRSGGNIAVSDGAGTGTTNGLFVPGLTTSTNGFASFASDAGVALAATGITNTLGKNAMAYVTATAVAFTIKDAASSTLYTSPTLTATMSVQLHPGWSVNAASGLAGTLLPE